jgi:hypothetical protein
LYPDYRQMLPPQTWGYQHPPYPASLEYPDGGLEERVNQLERQIVRLQTQADRNIRELRELVSRIHSLEQQIG